MSNSAPIDCDFCLDTPAVYQYPVEQFEDNWSACQECSDLIEAGDYESLTALSFVKWQAHHPLGMEAAAKLYEHLKRMHDEFRKHRNGDRRRL
jgi:hypothetical protein